MGLMGQQKQPNSSLTPGRRLQTNDNRGAAKPTGPKMPPGKTWLWLLAVLLANYFLVRFLLPSPEAPVTVPYTLFKQEVAKGNVAAIYSQGESITGRFSTAIMYPPADEKSPGSSGAQRAPEKDAAKGGESQTANERSLAVRGEPKAVSNFATTLPAFVDSGLEAFLIENGVEISVKPIEEGGSPLATLLFGFGPALLFIGFYIWMFRRAAQQGGGMGGLMGIGRSKARRYDQEKDAKVTFDHSYQVCAQCHARQVSDWAGGAHGKRMGGWAPPRVVAGCPACHDPHRPAWETRWPAIAVGGPR